LGIFSNVVTRILAFLVIGGVIAVGGFILRDVISGNVADIQVGDCFDAPTAAGKVANVQHHPCKEAHTAELVGIAVYPGGTNAAFPDEASLDNFAENQCISAFTSYTGRDPLTDPLLTLGAFYPTSDGWKKGDHAVTCFLHRVDEGTMTQSYRTGTT
jgi:hypothetical protein